MITLHSAEFFVKTRQGLVIGYLIFSRETDLDLPVKSRAGMSQGLRRHSLSKKKKTNKSPFFVFPFVQQADAVPEEWYLEQVMEDTAPTTWHSHVRAQPVALPNALRRHSQSVWSFSEGLRNAFKSLRKMCLRYRAMKGNSWMDSGCLSLLYLQCHNASD